MRRKDAQDVTNLQTSCNKAIYKPLTSCVGTYGWHYKFFQLLDNLGPAVRTQLVDGWMRKRLAKVPARNAQSFFVLYFTGSYIIYKRVPEHNNPIHLLSRHCLPLFYVKCFHLASNNGRCVPRLVHILHSSKLLAHHQHKTRKDVSLKVEECLD